MAVLAIVAGSLFGTSAIVIGHGVAMYAEEDTHSLRYSLIAMGTMAVIVTVYIAPMCLWLILA